ncbi:MAG: cysteine methyltransferase [Owenweeksia sp.]|nr:cysteine methyltransferase [Owenweeksia sp.]MBF97365.1 cysteine methyltransferase [Owenweeksia sp.]HBF21299.1 cysteine methyltransferase [Cryomorphaceae bacterium]HCQ16996.1 cysteine methyltransferase [Cryomorphaceae bacterium]|tara:strand:- start:456 stop:944 length:489 start_codon:yes stop_codon:yes gene_type:complete
MESLLYTHLETEVGLLEIEASDEALTRVSFLFEDAPQKVSSTPLLEEAKSQFKAYFNSRLQSFDLPMEWSGTDFQKSVWQQLMDIPFGHTTSYGALAARLGDPKTVRAVGSANGKNPLAIIVPCHRVIGSAGQLVGYAGGLHRKKWLLQFEARQLSGQMSIF